MMKNIKIMKNNILSLICILVLVGFVSSCTKYENAPPVFEELEDLTKAQRKVLVISIDGLSAEMVEESTPPVISGLLANSKYSYQTTNSESSAAGWASMLTGTGYKKHRIDNDYFEANPEGDDEDHDDVESYRNVIDYVTEFRNVKTAFVTPWESLRNYSRMADFIPEVKTDIEAKESTIELLGEEQGLGAVFVNFKDVETEGKLGGYELSNSKFKDALLKSDQYIGEILAALKKRKNYSKEEWLVVITSNHAGKSGSGVNNLFTIYNFDHFVGQELQAEIISAPRFYGYNDAGINAMRARNSAQLPAEVNYNIAETGEITVEAKIKANKNAAGNYGYSWPPFLSKVSARSGNTAGWSFFRSGDNVAFFVADGNSKIEINSNAAIGSNEMWTHLTGVFSKVDGKYVAKIYVNGNLASTGESTTLDVSKILSSSPLTFGFQPEVFSSAYFDFYMADVHIWNKALSDAEIKENANRVGVEATHSKIQNLVGYWPLNKSENNSFKNLVEGKPDLPIIGKPDFNTFANNLPYIKPEKAVLNKPEDVATQILYWFKIDINADWKLDGKNVLQNFEMEFLKD